jgi:hypothetical protein
MKEAARRSRQREFHGTSILHSILRSSRSRQLVGWAKPAEGGRWPTLRITNRPRRRCGAPPMSRTATNEVDVARPKKTDAAQRVQRHNLAKKKRPSPIRDSESLNSLREPNCQFYRSHRPVEHCPSRALPASQSPHEVSGTPSQSQDEAKCQLDRLTPRREAGLSHANLPGGSCIHASQKEKHSTDTREPGARSPRPFLPQC